MTDNQAAVRPPAEGRSSQEAILEIVRAALHNSSLGPDAHLFDNGATSLALVRILAQIHQDLGVLVHPPDLVDTVSASSLATYVDASRSLPSNADTNADTGVRA